MAASLQFKKVATLLVPVRDQDAARRFYVESLGFKAFADFEYAGGARWIEVEGPGGTRLTLVEATGDRPAGVETGIVFATADLQADVAALLADGVNVDEEITRESSPNFVWAGAVQAGVPPMARLYDPDGNSYLLVEGD